MTPAPDTTSTTYWRQRCEEEKTHSDELADELRQVQGQLETATRKIRDLVNHGAIAMLINNVQNMHTEIRDMRTEMQDKAKPSTASDWTWEKAEGS